MNIKQLFLSENSDIIEQSQALISRAQRACDQGDSQAMFDLMEQVQELSQECDRELTQVKLETVEFLETLGSNPVIDVKTEYDAGDIKVYINKATIFMSIRRITREEIQFVLETEWSQTEMSTVRFRSSSEGENKKEIFKWLMALATKVQFPEMVID